MVTPLSTAAKGEVPPDGRSDPYAVVERVIQLLDEGSFVSTYKHAVLLGLIDVCTRQGLRAIPTSMVTTRQLAEAVVELYWPQTRHWADRQGRDGSAILRQNAGVRGDEADSNSIVGLVYRFRVAAAAGGAVGVALPQVQLREPSAWKALILKVEKILVEMPLPKLQRIGGKQLAWLYRLGFDDRDEGALSRSFTRYVRGQPGDFDNAIRLMPGVAEAFVRLAPILRGFIQSKWAAKVAQLNELEEARLSRFLFGAAREDLALARAPLLSFQGSRCFYCGGRLGLERAHVDHFLPWSRLPENVLANLVVADDTCNRQKRDFLAHAPFLGQWRARNEGGPLMALAESLGWDLGAERTLSGARALYASLPDGARVWAGRDAFTVFDPADFEPFLG